MTDTYSTRLDTSQVQSLDGVSSADADIAFGADGSSARMRRWSGAAAQ
jgi:hypothetical protein